MERVVLSGLMDIDIPKLIKDVRDCGEPEIGVTESKVRVLLSHISKTKLVEYDVDDINTHYSYHLSLLFASFIGDVYGLLNACNDGDDELVGRLLMRLDIHTIYPTIGSKMTNRFGDRGVVTEIVPDYRML